MERSIGRPIISFLHNQSWQKVRVIFMGSGVARTPKNLSTSKGDYWIKQWFSSIAPLFEMGLLFKEGSKFFPLRAVPYGMENHFYHIR